MPGPSKRILGFNRAWSQRGGAALRGGPETNFDRWRVHSHVKIDPAEQGIMTACPVCNVSDAKDYGVVRPDVHRIDCRRCGEYDIGGTAEAILPAAFQKGIHRPSIMSHV